MRALRLIVSIVCFIQHVSSLSDGFLIWKSQHHKSYQSEEIERKASEVFLQNKKLIEDSTKYSSTWRMSLNKFADLSEEDFQSKYAMKKPYKVSEHNPPSTYLFPLLSIPEAFDWRYDGKTNVITSVKDQGSVGTCWAFSAVGNVEGQYALRTGELVEFSEEYLVDCDGTHDDTHADCSVFGGWPYLAYDFIVDSGGIPAEEDVPYCAGTGECYPCMLGPVSLCGPPPYYCDHNRTVSCLTYPKVKVISTWTSVSTDEKEIASALVQQGPLSVLLDATQLSLYQSGIWDGHIPQLSPLLGCHNQTLNHAVLLVGYGEENGIPYWTLKNSWSADWGEDGYFRIQRGIGLCGVNTAVTTSLA